MKSLIRGTILVLSLLFSNLSWAVPGIFFEGPKITDQKNNQTPILMPDDFAVYPFMGGPRNDAAVPSYIRTILGMDNLDNWPSTTPNTYFNVNTVIHEGNHILQVTEGNFDGKNSSDLLAINTSALNICFDFSGTACGSVSNTYHVSFMDVGGAPHAITPFAGAIADFDGDGKDDVAIIGYTYDTYTGFLTVYKGNQSSLTKPLDEPPLYQAEIPDGIPLSIAVGDYDKDGHLDIAVASMPGLNYLGGAFGTFFKNLGGTFSLNNHVFNFEAKDCYSPTGLLAYDGNGDGQDDLVLTCYQGLQCLPNAIACIPSPVSGPVVLFKNDGGGTSFSAQQTIQKLEFPYTSTIGDYNGDSQIDLAVASNGGKGVYTFAGTGPLQVQDPGNKISTAPYSPKFIQTQLMNGDILPDLIMTANDPHLPVLRVTDAIPIDQLINFADLPVASVMISRTMNAQGKVYFTSTENFTTALKKTDVAFERNVQRVSANQIKFDYSPNRVQREFTSALYYPETDLQAQFPDYYIEIPPFDLIPTHGVLVLVNSRPEVSIDEPQCDVTTVIYRCTGTSGNPVVECTFSSSDPALSATPASPAGPATEMTGTITLPKDLKKHSFTITAKDSTNNVVSGDFSVDFAYCPGTDLGSCPATPVEKTVINGKPYIICAFEGDEKLATAMAGKKVSWAQTRGPDIFTAAKGVVLDAAKLDGACLSGRLGVDYNTKPENIDLLYSVEGGPQNCPAKLIQPGPMYLEGSGNLCSLTLPGTQAPSFFSVILEMLFLPLGTFFLLRKKILRD